MPFLRASLRQTMIRKLASVGKDKEGWKKADEHLTTLMDQEHMITPPFKSNPTDIHCSLVPPPKDR